MTKNKKEREYPYKRKHLPITPFAKWLAAYAAENNTTLVAMAEEAGLSRSALYKFVQNPLHKPDLRTVLLLSEYTGKPADEIARLAGIAGYKPQEPIGPDLRELMNIYNRLPAPMKGYLLTNALQLADSVKAIKPHSSG